MPERRPRIQAARARWGGFVEASCLLLWLPLAVRLMPWRLLRRLAEAWGKAGNGDALHTAAALALIDRIAVTRGTRRYLTCLPVGLLRLKYLRRLGQPARLHLGMCRHGARWSGHAWVSVNGRAYGEDPEQLAHLWETMTFPSSVPEQQPACPSATKTAS